MSDSSLTAYPYITTKDKSIVTVSIPVVLDWFDHAVYINLPVTDLTSGRFITYSFKTNRWVACYKEERTPLTPKLMRIVFKLRHRITGLTVAESLEEKGFTIS